MGDRCSTRGCSTANLCGPRRSDDPDPPGPESVYARPPGRLHSHAERLSAVSRDTDPDSKTYGDASATGKRKHGAGHPDDGSETDARPGTPVTDAGCDTAARESCADQFRRFIRGSVIVELAEWLEPGS